MSAVHEPMAGRIVLVTGAARRVGAAITTHLHTLGASVILHYRRSAMQANALADSLNASRPNSAWCLHADLDDPKSLQALVDNALECAGRLDALVNNASTFYPTPLGQITEDAWREIVGSNFMAPLFLSQSAARHLRRSRGAIVNITDIHAERPLKDYPLYCAAKGALLTLTRALAIELAPEVRVNAVAPGPILWPEGQMSDTGYRREIVDHTLLKREGSPEDIASAVGFLLTGAGYVTGQVINVDGGRTAHL